MEKKKGIHIVFLKKKKEEERGKGSFSSLPPEILQVSRIRLYSILKPSNSISLMLSLIEEIASIWEFAHVYSRIITRVQGHTGARVEKPYRDLL